MQRHLTVVTNSQLSTFRRCQREHHYAYQLGYRTNEDAEALRFGTLWHRALEAWWQGQGLDAALDAATADAVDGFEAARARVLLRGYDARWGGEVHDVVSVEREFYAPLCNPETGAPSRTYELGGKLDVLLRDRFVEHKTTGEDIGLGSIYWRRLLLDPQVSTYYAGAKALGHEVRSCLYDVVRKPGLRPSKALPVVDEDGCRVVLSVTTRERVRTKNGKRWRESADASAGHVMLTRDETPEEYEARLTDEVAAHPDRYYQRGDVVRLEGDEHEAALDRWFLVEAMAEGQRLDRYPRNPDACLRYNRMCSYFSICTGTASLDDPAYFHKITNVHPELTER